MNTEDYFKANDDGIGIDPTAMPVIESLDVLPAENNKEEKGKNKKKKTKGKTRNPDKKPGDLLKKILFTVVILLLMAGVAFGVYYYLSLGTKGPGKGKFTLENKEIFVGDALPTSVMEYGDFSTVDISECALNIMDVDVNTIGEYDYSIVCGKAKYTAKIIVVEKVVFDLATLPVYKVAGEEIAAEEFIDTSRDDYSYAFVDSEAVTNYMSSTGGPYVVDIMVTNESAKETVVSALLYVVSDKVSMYLTCNSSKQKVNDYEFTVTDRIAFDGTRNNMGLSLRFHNYIFEDDTDYEKMKKQISEGKIAINNHEGYALIDNVNKKIKIVNNLDDETLNEEYGSVMPTNYNDINSYYRNTKKYSCSI